MMLTRDKNDGEQTDLLHLEKYFRSSFNTYNKDKPAKYGLNFRSLGSSRRPYMYYTVPYTGKPAEVSDSHKKDILALVKQIFEGYEQHGYSLKGTNMPFLWLNGYTAKILLP